MQLDEGYIKYEIHWEPGASIQSDLIPALIHWRQQMFQRKWIGFYPDLNVGFGNISIRYPGPDGKFLISGTQTGHIQRLRADHISLVTKYDIDANQLFCKGSIKASSEALTHAAVYECAPDCQAVIHVHSLSNWQGLLNNIPTSRKSVAYGTPEMAKEVHRLFEEEKLDQYGIFAMAGHEEGLIAFGRDLETAADILDQYLVY